MIKHNRNYKILIDKKDGSTLEVRLPFTIEFQIHRSSFSSANVASFRIYNLNADNRNQVQHNQYDPDFNRIVTFFAGYGEHYSVGFRGRINQAWSVREGTNMITQIESYDGGFAYVNAVTNNQYVKGTANQAIIEDLAQSLTKKENGGLSIGAIGAYDGVKPRGNSVNGNTVQVLSEMVGDGFFIDNEKMNCLKDSECLDGDTLIISPESGLLGTPLIEQQYINIEMLFEPNVRVGQLVELQSVTADENLSFAGVNAFTKFNGIHKVVGIVHKGTISDAVCGSAITSLALLPGNFTPIPSRS